MNYYDGEFIDESDPRYIDLPVPYVGVVTERLSTVDLKPAFKSVGEMHTVEFHANGGWFNGDMNQEAIEVQVEDGQAAVCPVEPEFSWKESFSHWEEEDTAYDMNNVTEDFTVYAHTKPMIPVLYETIDTQGFESALNHEELVTGRYAWDGGFDIDYLVEDDTYLTEELYGQLYSITYDEEPRPLGEYMEREVYLLTYEMEDVSEIVIPYYEIDGYEARVYFVMDYREFMIDDGAQELGIVDYSEYNRMYDGEGNLYMEVIHDEPNEEFVFKLYDGGIDGRFGGYFAVLYEEAPEVIEPDPEPVAVSSSTPTIYYQITLKSSEGGSVDPYEGSKRFAKGIVGMDVVASADEGYEFIGFSGDTEFYNDGRFSLSQDIVLRAEFELIELEDEATPEFLFDGFNDISGHWAEAELFSLGSRSIVNGVGNGDFEPNRFITRAEFTTMVVDAVGLKNSYMTPFGDVENHWGREAIEKAFYSGIVEGTGNGFEPDRFITRQEMAKIVTIAFGLKESGALLEFDDADDVADWAAGYVSGLVEAGILTGDDENMLNLLGYGSRAEAGVMIYRGLELIK